MALDIAPPSAPGAHDEQTGFFSKLFRKKQKEQPQAAPEAADQLSSFEGKPNLEEEAFDLDEIRRKLGADKPVPTPPPETPVTEQAMTRPASSPEPLPPTRKGPIPETPIKTREARMPTEPNRTLSRPTRPEHAPVEEPVSEPVSEPERVDVPAPETEPAAEPIEIQTGSDPIEIEAFAEQPPEPEKHAAEEEALAELETEDEAPAPSVTVDDWTAHDQPSEHKAGSEWVTHAEPDAETASKSEWEEHHPQRETRETHHEPSEWTDEVPAGEPAAPTPQAPESEETAPKPTGDEEPGASVAAEAVPDEGREEKAAVKKEARKAKADVTAPEQDLPEAPATETSGIQAPAAEPDEPVRLDDVAGAHFKELEEEHRQLDEELNSIVEGSDALPENGHPLDKKAPAGSEFVLKSGQKLKSLRDLMQAMEVIDEETFKHHVDGNKNDFAAWLKHVMEEEQLADEIRNATARQELMRILEEHEERIQEEFLEEEHKLDELLQQRGEKLEKASAMDQELESLKHELDDKSAQLADKRKLITAEVERRLAEEVEKRLAEERAKLEEIREEAEAKRQEYEKRLEVMGQAYEQKYEKRELKTTELEEKVMSKKESLQKLEQTLKEEKAKLEAAKKETETMLEKAKPLEEQMARIDEDRAKLQEEQEAFKAEKRSMNGKQAGLVKREKSIDALKERLEKEEAAFKEQKEKLETALQEREAALKKAEADLKQERAAFDKESKELRAAFEKEMKEGRAALDRETKDFRAEQQKTLAKVKAERKKVEERIKKAEDAETRAEEKLQERRKIAQYVQEAEKNIERHQERLGREGFHTYLQGKLTGTTPPPESVRNLQIYTMIDKARHALTDAEVAEARDLYKQIRGRFNKEQLSPNEKQVLYTTIRELYDDIQLASLKA